MRHTALLLTLALVVPVCGQSSRNPFAAAEQTLGWRVAGPLNTSGAPAMEVTSSALPPGSPTQRVTALRDDLRSKNTPALVYRIETALGSDSEWTRAFATASQLGAEVVVVTPPSAGLDRLAKAAADSGITLALDGSGALLQPGQAVNTVRGFSGKVRVWAHPTAWTKAGIDPLTGVYMLREYLAGGTLDDSQTSDEFLREAYRLDIKPLIWIVPADGQKRASDTVEALVAYHRNYASRTRGVRRLGRITPEERAQLEAALPDVAPAKPQKARKLLVFDLNVGRFGHPSIPYANLAMQLMGTKTGAFEATVSSDPAILQPQSLKQFDAVYLNNTIGDIFATPEAREGFRSFVANGGGVMGNHATTVTATDWKEFGDILGARGASHRMTDEKVVVNVEDPDNPIVKGFAPGPFEYTDEIFRFEAPYSRDNVRVLLSVDPLATDLNQGQCYGRCYRDDSDYPVAWIHQYGKGRIFYTSFGHNPHVFWQPNMLKMFLAAAQYILGDLDVNEAPLKRTSNLDQVLRDVATYDWGQDEGPVRQLERAMGMLGPGAAESRAAEQKLLAVLKGRPKPGAIEAITRQLAVVGSAASVAALAPLLADKQTADMARYALERIDAPEAVTALRGALQKVSDVRSKTGIIYSLGRRKDQASVPALQTLMSANDPSVSATVVNALGLIGGADAEQALLASSNTPGAADALLTLAEHTTSARAAAIYQKLSAPSAAEPVRIAAINGQGRLGIAEPLRKALASTSPNIQTAAVLNLARISPETVVSASEGLPPAVRIQALNALALQGAQGARPAILAAVKSSDEAVRVAALNALGIAGAAEDVPLLVSSAVAANSQERAAARFSLSQLQGGDVDTAIVSSIPNAQQAARVELIRIAGERAIASAQDTLLVMAKDADGTVRRESLRALKGIVQPEKSAALIDLLVASSEDDRPDAAQALAAAVSRSLKPDLKPIETAFDKTQDGSVRASLISAAAFTGHPTALPLVRKALESTDADVERAAITGLSNWPSADPMDDLLRMARTSQNPSLKVLALRGYINLVRRPAGRSAADTAKLLGSAMEVASRPDEKKAVLAALQRVVTPESLKIVQAAAGDPAITAEAKLAADTLERALKARGE